MKKEYKKPDLNYILLDVLDIITTSTDEDPFADDGGDDPEWGGEF